MGVSKKDDRFCGSLNDGVGERCNWDLGEWIDVITSVRAALGIG